MFKDGGGLRQCRVSLRAYTCMPIHAQQSFRFINGKNEACFHMKRNPRKINWTLFYRRLRKKGTQVQNFVSFSLPASLSPPRPRGPSGTSGALQDMHSNATLDVTAGKRGFDIMNTAIYQHGYQHCFQHGCSLPSRLLALSVEH